MEATYTSTELAPETNDAFECGIEAILGRSSPGARHGLLIGGAWKAGGGGTLEEWNPARLDQLTGTFARADDADVEGAVAAARAAQKSWGKRSRGDRTQILLRAAEILERRLGEFAAAATLEVGKNRLESVGEVAEAVALIRYYSEQAGRDGDIALEAPDDSYRNTSVMRPFGVFGVISPFNFPIALLIGPATAAMLTGNTVVAKPSPTTSLVSVLLAEALIEAGLPDGVFNLVTGGDATGRALVASAIDGLVFTGSYAAGQAIRAQFDIKAGYVRPCIIEMGGKNPTIVTASADLNAAASGIAASAFGLSGQKCSACSRVLVEGQVGDQLVELLADAGHEWKVGDPVAPDSRLGPVHTVDSVRRYEAAVADAGEAGGTVVGGRVIDHPDLNGHYVEPTIVSELPSEHRLLRDELFLPFVAVERVDSLDEALHRANDQLYGLTAGFFGAADEVEVFLERIEAGTLFVNRAAGATSGGWPGQQTYPGWKGSGSTNRGGLGPRYVEQFEREQGRNIVAPPSKRPIGQ